MRFDIGTAATVLIAVATAATAEPARLTDMQFVAANRCLGLMSSKTLGTADAPAMRKLVKDQSGGRERLIFDQADQARNDAEVAAGRGGAELRARLISERDGVCHSFLSSTAAAAADGGGRS